MFAVKKKKDLPWCLSWEEKRLDTQCRQSAIAGDTNNVKQCISAGASVNHVDKIYGRSILSWTQNDQIAQFLLDLGVNVNAVDFLRQSALHRAIIAGAPVEYVELLLKSGIHANLRDITGLTALDWSKQIGLEGKIVELLESVTTVEKPAAAKSNEKPDAVKNEKPEVLKKKRKT